MFISYLRLPVNQPFWPGISKAINLTNKEILIGLFSERDTDIAAERRQLCKGARFEFAFIRHAAVKLCESFKKFDISYKIKYVFNI